jgi:hypothetical protein
VEAAERITTAGIRERMVCFDFGIQGEDVRRKITIQETTMGNNENRTEAFGGGLLFRSWTMAGERLWAALRTAVGD